MAMGSTTGDVGVAAQPAAIGADREAWREVLADVAVVTVTPFRGDRLERVDHDGLRRNLEHVLAGGARLLVAGGNTGEFASLARVEAIEIARTHVDVAAGRARVLAGIGYRLERAIELGRASVEAGADGLMVHHPTHPYASEAGLVDYYEAIADALPGVPLVLYVRGPQLDVDGARRLARVPSIVGVKMGVADPARFGRLVDAAPELAWVCGVAEAWAVPFWRQGSIGFTSGLANIVPERSLELLDSLRAGDVDLAERLVERLRSIEALRARHGDANNVAVIKAGLDLLELAGGAVRPPLSGLDAEDRDELVRILRAMEVPS